MNWVGDYGSAMEKVRKKWWESFRIDEREDSKGKDVRINHKLGRF